MRSSAILLPILIVLAGTSFDWFPSMARSKSASMAEAAPTCTAEFDRCVMNRDCCEGLSCVAGDWAVTTDSTCLSKRSELLNALSNEQKVHLIQKYYASSALSALPDAGERATKTPEEASKLATKYIGSSFAQLVSRLERKYKVVVIEKEDLGQLAASSDSHSEL